MPPGRRSWAVDRSAGSRPKRRKTFGKCPQTGPFFWVVPRRSGWVEGLQVRHAEGGCMGFRRGVSFPPNPHPNQGQRGQEHPPPPTWHPTQVQPRAPQEAHIVYSSEAVRFWADETLPGSTRIRTQQPTPLPGGVPAVGWNPRAPAPPGLSNRSQH